MFCILGGRAGGKEERKKQRKKEIKKSARLKTESLAANSVFGLAWQVYYGKLHGRNFCHSLCTVLITMHLPFYACCVFK